MRRLELAGKRFGKWLVVANKPTTRNRMTYWACVCDCGTARAVLTNDLVHGNSKDCGCGRTKKLNDWKFEHGMSYHPMHGAWRMMIDRCYNPRNKRYYDYGGRGITVCERWRNSFMAFYEDMGERPPGKSLDRTNNDGPYSKENCRWEDARRQRMNVRRRSQWCLLVMFIWGSPQIKVFRLPRGFEDHIE